MTTPIRVEIELADGSFTTGILRAGQKVRDLQRAVEQANPALANLSAGFAMSNTQARDWMIRLGAINGAMANIKTGSTGVVTGIKAMDRESKGFLATMRDLSIVVGIVSVGFGKLMDIQNSWIGDIIKVNSEMERLAFQMRSMSKAADPVKDAADTIAFLRQTSLQTPLTLQTLTNGFVKLKATGTDPLNGSLQAVADGVAAFGGSDEAFNRSILAISQMSGKGVIQMEELRQQLGESMPRAVELMARSMGVSMSQLIKDISSGTVQSRQALQLFYAELDRTYGGRAQFMMQTFEGQLKRTQTSLQILADNGGESFFGAVKAQLKDLGDFLSSDTAKKFANDLGQGMAGVVNSLRSVLDYVVRMRNELGRVASVATALFGGVLAAKAITGIATSWRLLSVAVADVGLAFTRAGQQANIAMIAMNSRAGIGSAIGMVSNLTRAVGTLAMGFAGIAPWIAGLGFGVYALGEYFGVFSNKVKDAYDELVKFGAESRKQATEAIEARRAQLEAELANLHPFRGETAENYEARLGRAKAELDKLNQQADKLIGDAAKREDERMLTSFRDMLNEKRADLQGEYDAEAIIIQDSYDKQEAILREAGKSTEALNAERAQKLKDASIKFYADQAEILRKALAVEQDAQKIATGVAADQIQQRINLINSMLREALEAQHAAQESPTGVPTLPKAISDAAAYKKGEQALDKLRAETDGLKAALQGASAEVAELQTLLAEGKYGDADTKKVQELSAALVEAQKEKEKLDELFKAKQQLEGDLERVRLAQIQEAADLEAKASEQKLSDLDKLNAKIEAGGYKGFGPDSAINKTINGVVGGIQATGDKAVATGDILRDNTFGASTVARVDVVTSAVSRLAAVIGSVSGGLAGLDFAGVRLPAGGAGPTRAAAALLPTVEDTDRLVEYNGQMMKLSEARAKLAESEEKLKVMRKDAALLDFNRDLNAQIEAENVNVDNLHKNYAKLVKDVNLGKLGDSTDINDPRYAEAVKTAKELDRLAASHNASTKAGNELETQRENILQRQVDLAARMEDATDRLADPLEQKTSSGFRSLRRELDKYLAGVRQAYGEDTAAFGAALELKSQMLANFRNVEIAEEAAGWSQNNIELRRSMLSQSQARAEELRDELAKIDKAVNEFSGAEEEKVAIVAAAEERKKLLRQKYAEETTPFLSQMREWGDLAQNLGEASTRWMDNLAEGFTDLILEGKSLGDVLKSILKDIANIALKWALSGLTNGFGGGAGKGGTAKVAHTGGIIGESSLATRRMDMSSFVGAPRFHAGGIIGADEVPVIAQKGEGMFTREQMKALGGMPRATTYQVNAPISIGPGGSPEQNQDLADRTARSLKETIRAIAAEEIHNAQRAGNSLNQRIR